MQIECIVVVISVITTTRLFVDAQIGRFQESLKFVFDQSLLAWSRARVHVFSRAKSRPRALASCSVWFSLCCLLLLRL